MPACVNDGRLGLAPEIAPLDELFPPRDFSLVMRFVQLTDRQAFVKDAPMFNARFWSRHFECIFVPHLNRLLGVLEQRLLPTFDSVDKDAKSVEDAEYERLMSMPGDPDQDPSLVAEQAFEAGVEHYVAMSAIRQSLINSYAATLYHAWEQQLLSFHRREVLLTTEEHEHDLLKLKVLRERLLAVGIDIAKLPSWAAIDELRLLTNAVKHAEGNSADKLKQLRPELFEHPSTRELGLPYFNSVPRVYMPLSGEDIFVTPGSLRSYCAELVQFWSEFGDVLLHA